MDAEKAAYFGLLASLDDDELDAREQRDRRRRFRFFGTTPPPARQGAATAGGLREATRPCSTGMRDGAVRDTAGMRDTAVRDTAVRDTASAAPEPAVPEPAVPEPAQPAQKALRHGEPSPSVAARAKRRKRSSDAPPPPPGEQVFGGLAFFYIPDNDIAPARRLRIAKAREYGAVWTRDVATATHLVVDKSLCFDDVDKFLPKSAAGPGKLPALVNEDYPIDCIQFRSLLDHAQSKYRVAGQPATAGDRAGEDGAPARAEEPAGSLQLKPERGSRGRETRARPGTPPRSADSSQSSVVDATPAPMDSQPITLDLGQRSDDTDDLSAYISMMHEYKHLPLDQDDDTRSVAGQEEDDDADSEAEHTRHPRAKRRARPERKEIGFEERFACNQAGEKDAHAQNPNARTIEVLQSMADYYERTNDHWRTTGYRKAMTTLKRQGVKICTEDEAFRLPHIGRRIAQKIEEIVATDRLRRLEHARDSPTDGVLQLFLQIYGVGPRQAQQWIAQGHRTLDDLVRKAKLTPSQAMAIAHHDDLQTRIPRREVEALGAVVRRAAAHIDPEAELIVGGSYRRGAESSGDIDLIVTRRGTAAAGELRPLLDRLVRRLEADGFLVARLASSRAAAADGSIWHGCCVLPGHGGGVGGGGSRPVWRRIDFLLVPETEMGGALIYFTGNDIFNRSMRLLAAKKGMRLNQRGLWRDGGGLVEGRDERRIFEVLGVRWREPHERWC